MSRARLFVAVGLPADVRSAVAGAARRLHGTADARWTDPASWHLTLAFLGWVDGDGVPAVEAALSAVAARHEALELRLTGTAGMFGRRVLWAGVAENPALAELGDSVRAALAPLGFAPEKRPFHPHLTLARTRKGTLLPRDLAGRYEGPAAAWQADTLDLMRSHLASTGARYERVAAWPLRARGDGGGGGGI